MVRDRLHIICGNCGCSTMFSWRYDPKADDVTVDEPEFRPGVSIICNNCSTVHRLGDNAKMEEE